MAIQKEIWIESILEPFKKESSFLDKATEHSEFISGKTVHVPNAGGASKSVKNSNKLPLEIKGREDFDLTYSMDDYKMPPVVIEDAEKVELSYNKRESVISVNRAALYEDVAKDTIHKWVYGVEKPMSKNGKTPKQWIKEFAKQFDKDGVSKEERYLMFTVDQYYEFLDSLTSKEQFAFSACADAAKGILGNYFGFEVLKEFFLPEGVEAFAWQKNSVSKAMGEVKIYDNSGVADYYGDIISFQVRAGGAAIRFDKKGIACVTSSGKQISAPPESTQFKEEVSKTEATKEEENKEPIGL